MPRISISTLSIVVILLVMATAPGAVSAAEPNEPLAGAPTVVSYQGQVTISGTAFAGPTGYFKFAVVDQTGTTTYWSNDATSAGGGQPTDAVSLPVSQGLFNVLLGDTSLSNMTSLTAPVFSGTSRYLRVWFSSTGAAGSFTQLSPDRRVAAAPFALQAQEANNAAALGGYAAGNASGNVPLSNGTLNTNLNADILDGKQGTAYQQRVSGACAVGSTVRSINADGTVVCESHATRPTFTRGTMDSAGDVGKYVAVTTGIDGMPLIAYQDATDSNNPYLKVAHCNDPTCSTATITALDTSAGAGFYISATVYPDGLPVIVYYLAGESHDLAFARCRDVACTSADYWAPDDIGDVGQFASVTIGSDGMPLISYYDATNGNLKVAHCYEFRCNGAVVSTLDSTGDVGQYTSIATGTDGLGIISYYDKTHGDLRAAHCSNVDCSTATITTLDSTGDVGYNTAIAIDGVGMPVISYSDSTGDLRVAKCDATCSSLVATGAAYAPDGTSARTSSILVSGSPMANSLGISGDGWPLMLYADGQNGLMLFHWIDYHLSEGVIYQLDTGDAGKYSSTTVGGDGLPFVAYYAPIGGDLKVIHCSTNNCAPYWSRR